MLHKRIWELTEGIRCGIVFLSLIKIMITFTFILSAICMSALIEVILDYSKKDRLLILFIMLVLILFVRAALIFFLSYKEKYYSGKIKSHLRQRCINHFFDIGPAFFNNERTGKIQTLMVSGIEYLEAYLVRYIPQLLVTVVGSMLITYNILRLNLTLGIFVAVMLLLTVFVPYFWKKIIRKSSKEHWNAFSKLNAQYVDGVQGMVTLISFQADEKYKNVLALDSRNLFLKTMCNLRNSLISIGSSDIFMTLGSAMTIGLGAYFFASGSFSRGALLTLLFLSREAFRPVEDLKKFYHQGFNGISAADSLFELFGHQIPNEENLRDISYIKDPKDIVIEFNNVSFRYQEDLPYVLKNISFRIEPAKKIAIVGESGNGKSTIINLLLKFYTEYEGEILINGIDLRQISSAEIRKLFSLVAQETYMFNTSVIDNIKLADQTSSHVNAQQAIKDANLMDFINNLEEKEKTIIGERGSKVSGGEKQRISIARAILKNAPILLLDEATSSLDNRNERAIKRNLDHLMKGRSALIIAHRLSTIVDADEILVLEKGHVVQSGTHEELLRKKGIYYELFNKQLKEVTI